MPVTYVTPGISGPSRLAARFVRRRGTGPDRGLPIGTMSETEEEADGTDQQAQAQTMYGSPPSPSRAWPPQPD